MAGTILLPNEFKVENVDYLPPRVNKLGGQACLISYNNTETEKNGPFILQTCRVRIPFGIDQSNLGDSGEVKYNISFAMANDETKNENLILFTKNIRDIDEKTKKKPLTDESWFGKKLSKEFIEETYKSAEKFPKDKDSKWPSNLKVKLPFDRKGDPQFFLYDENKNRIDVTNKDGSFNTDSIPRGCEAVCLIQSTGVWFLGKAQFGVNYKLLQAKIFKSDKLSGYSIVDSEPEDDVESNE